jgi:hypothetical protein
LGQPGIAANAANRQRTLPLHGLHDGDHEKGELGDTDHVWDNARREGAGELRGGRTLPPRSRLAPPTKKNHEDGFSL